MPEDAFLQDENPEQARKRSSILPRILTIVGLVIGSGAIGAASSWFVASRALRTAEAKVEEPAEPIDPEAVRFSEMVEKGAVIPLEPFVVNLADPDAPRFLRITMTLMVDDRKKVEELMTNQTVLSKARDLVLQILTEKTSAELMKQEGKNALRQQIHQKLEGYFKEPKLVDVMFTELVIQL